MTQVSKRPPAPDYPPETGCFLRGNDYSPVAVLVILSWPRERTPPDIEHLTRVAIEGGAALAGTLQTENIGLEKVICNLVANTNIRYLVVCGPESPGHLVGDAIRALAANGVDATGRIIGARAPTPYLFNIPPASIERFRQQVTVLDLVDEGSPEVLLQAVQACYQESPTRFRDLLLHDPGAYPEPPLSGSIVWRVTNPEREPKSAGERDMVRRFHDLAGRIQQAVADRRQAATAPAAPGARKTGLLFLCTGNSCRSQMAEAWCRALKHDLYEARSAGIVARGLNPKMVQVMREVGLDPCLHQTSKTLADLLASGFRPDIVVTVCGHAHESCPVFPGGRTRVVHAGFADPPELERTAASPEEALGHYRRVRDQIRDFVGRLPESLATGPLPPEGGA